MYLLNYRISCLLISLIAFLTLGSAQAQTTKKEKDKQAIKEMLGCYDVTFKYTETFSPEVDYEKAYDYHASGLELAQLVEETEDKIVIQHLLIVNDTTVIKHWRQDWIYEDTESYRYDGNNTWVYDPKSMEEVRGKWTQNVYQVDDSPRYSGTATWVHVDGSSTWYHKADSPLPRREYTKRSDYNIMKRGNRLHITDYGWLHEQDNDKVIRTDTGDVLLVQEKGYNHYYQRPEKDCQLARDWWDQNKDMWVNVRDSWQEIYNKKNRLELKLKVEDKRLYEHLFDSKIEWSEDKVDDIIHQYIVSTENQ